MQSYPITKTVGFDCRATGTVRWYAHELNDINNIATCDVLSNSISISTHISCRGKDSSSCYGTSSLSSGVSSPHHAHDDWKMAAQWANAKDDHERADWEMLHQTLPGVPDLDLPDVEHTKSNDISDGLRTLEVITFNYFGYDTVVGLSKYHTQPRDEIRWSNATSHHWMWGWQPSICWWLI